MLQSNILKGYYKNERMNLNPKQQTAFSSFFKNIRQKPQVSEKCLGHLFSYGPYSQNSLIPIIKRHHKNIPIKMYFGENDWIDYKRTQDTLKEMKLDVPLEILPKSGHQMVFQQPLQLAWDITWGQRFSDRVRRVLRSNTFLQKLYEKKYPEVAVENRTKTNFKFENASFD